jgi:UDP-N-acetylmuramoyl-L-alanyl-D-glutamate--2,6-diaminopimelate ligase
VNDSFPGQHQRDAGRRLTQLLRELSGVAAAPAAEATHDMRVQGMTVDSRHVRAGTLFVAVRGTQRDGHDYIDAALAAGAVALVVAADAQVSAPVPVIAVHDTRLALAELAAAWHGQPVRQLTLAGITGTVGKTSVLSLLEEILGRAGMAVGSIGSLGLRRGAETLADTGYTAPDPLTLQAGLRRLHDDGARIVITEATSHALMQQRLAGVTFQLGIFTNLVPLEHSEYHRTFRDYVAAKRRFFDHLDDCAPLVYSADDRAVRRLVHDYPIEPIGCGTSRTAHVRLEIESLSARGTRLTLNLRRPLPRLGGGSVQPLSLPLELHLLGRSNLANAGLAAAAALSLGASPEHVQAVLRAAATPKRRMQILRAGSFTVLDDTVGHPDSVSAVFEVADQLRPRRLHVAFGMRGSRGVRINRQLGKSLAIWAGRLAVQTLVVTRCEDAADERNRVSDRERAAFVAALEESGIRFTEERRLEPTVQRVVTAAGDGDLVLLLGAQGMDRAAGFARRWLPADAAA